MPQMMPINWMLSFLFFITIFIMFNIMNYYIFFYKLPNNNKKLNNFLLNYLYWKW